MRTIGTLERKAREGVGAIARERALERHIEEYIGEGPSRTREAIVSHFARFQRGDVERAVGALVGEGRVLVEPTAGEAVYRLDHRYVSLLGSDPALRLDGLHHQMDVLSAAVHARFLDGGRHSTARTLSFVATPEAMDVLLATLHQTLRDACAAAEDSSLDLSGHQTYGATVAVGPMDVTVAAKNSRRGDL